MNDVVAFDDAASIDSALLCDAVSIDSVLLHDAVSIDSALLHDAVLNMLFCCFDTVDE